MSENDKQEEYKVGYRKPPVEHQFKPGNPGGPGRPRKQITFHTLVAEELYKDGGIKAKKIVDNLISSATHGNAKAVNIVISLSREG